MQCLYVTGNSQSVPAYEQCLLAEFQGDKTIISH